MYDPCLKSPSAQGPFHCPPITILHSWYWAIYWPYFPFPIMGFPLIILSFFWSWLWALDSGVLSTVLWPSSQSTTSPPVCPALCWELCTSHYRGWEAHCLLSVFCSLCFPHSKTEKQRKSSKGDRGDSKDGRRQAEWDVGISTTFLLYNRANSHVKGETREPNKGVISQCCVCVLDWRGVLKERITLIWIHLWMDL